MTSPEKRSDLQLENGQDRAPTKAEDAKVEELFSSGKSITPEALYEAADAHGVHEHRSGRLVLDPVEAEREFGPAIASRLKVDKNGTILWPQPDDTPLDPQNWSDRKKAVMLAIISAAAFVPDFDSGLGIASLFALAEQFNTTTDEINNLTSNWSIFLLGPGGVIWVFFIRRFGRLPVVFWTQLIALGFLIGATFAPNLSTFAAMRCLTAFFGTCTQISGLYTVADLYPAHQQDTKLAIWTAAFIISPFLSPFLGGFIVATQSWRWVYGFGCFYGALVVVLIALFLEETMYDRYVTPRPERPSEGLRYRIETLLGITGWRMRKYRTPWLTSIYDMFDVAWRPHTLLVCVFAGCMFGFGIGINVTQAVFIGSPPPLGYGFDPNSIAGSYATPIVAVVLGELFASVFLRFIVRRLTKANHGVFEAEMGIWTSYIALPLFVAGMVTLGYAFQDKLSYVAVPFGWGMAEFAIMLNTTTFYAYLNACFPTRRGEVSALLNFARTMFGFAVPYYIVDWSLENGAAQSFGCEAAIVAGLFLLIVPFLQLRGSRIRNTFSIKDSAASVATM